MSFWEDLEDDIPRGYSPYKNQDPDAKWGKPEGDHWLKASNIKDIDGFFLGYDEDDCFVSWKDDRHILTVTGTRGGKGVSLIKPCLIHNKTDSLFVIDHKGELASSTKEFRRDKIGNNVFVFDPFETSGQPTDCFNPLDELDYKDEKNLIDNVSLIADAIIVNEGKDPYWCDMARYFLKALILLVITPNVVTYNKEDQTLLRVRELITLQYVGIREEASERNIPPIEVLWGLMAVQTNDQFYGGIVRATQIALEAVPEKQFESIFSTLRKQTEFLDSPKMANVLKHSNFRLKQLKKEKTTIYLCLPAGAMGFYSKWLRTMITLALIEFERSEYNIPVLMVLDEFPILGNMKVLQNAAGYIAGFDVKLWFIIQNMQQLEDHYAKSWETFTGNSGCITFFANTEDSTLSYIQKMLGVIGVFHQDPSGASQMQGYQGISSERDVYRETNLMHKHEISIQFNRSKERILVLAAGQKPVILRRSISYKNTDPFKGYL